MWSTAGKGMSKGSLEALLPWAGSGVLTLLDFVQGPCSASCLGHPCSCSTPVVRDYGLGTLPEGTFGESHKKKTCLSISISHSPGPRKAWTSLFNPLVSAPKVLWGFAQSSQVTSRPASSGPCESCSRCHLSSQEAVVPGALQALRLRAAAWPCAPAS